MKEAFMIAQLWFAVLLLFDGAVADRQPHAIDTQRSTMRIHVYKTGALSALGHEHEIAAPIASGKVDVGAQSVELQVDARALRVEDPKGPDKDRPEVQKTMLGPEVLDVERDPRITFRSTGARSAGANAWKLNGSLTLHGQTRPVTVEVSERDGHYVGHSLVRQTDFGIKPPGKAGVRAKDEVRIEFDIVLAR
jgi:polyisoprenoid-binding protein YceI